MTFFWWMMIVKRLVNRNKKKLNRIKKNKILKLKDYTYYTDQM